MADSFIQYTASGSTDTFAIPFGYLDPDHITVSVDGTSVAFTFPSASEAQITSGNPAASAVVEVRRTTPRDNREVVWQNAANLTASDLNTSDLQFFYIVQEAFDSVVNVLSQDSTGNFDAITKRIVNLVDPVNAQDAATKAYADGTLALTAQDVIDAEAAKVAAELAETNAAASESAAAATLAQVETLYDNFDDRYLGTKTSDPALDNDGDPLIDGALYFNTTTNKMNIYDLGGTVWNEITQLVGDDSITNAKLADVATNTIKGRTSSGTGDPEDLSAAQVRAILDVYTQTQVDAAVSAASGLGTPDFTSPAQTPAAGTDYTIAHGLGVRPKLARTVYRCKTADAGYPVGTELDAVPFFLDDTSGTGRREKGTWTSVDDTNIYLVSGSNGAMITWAFGAGGEFVDLTNANWDIITYLWI